MARGSSRPIFPGAVTITAGRDASCNRLTPKAASRAAILGDRHRPIAALSVSAPASRLSLSAARKVGPHCAETAARVSRELGGTPA